MSALFRLSQVCLRRGLISSTVKQIGCRTVNTSPKKSETDELIETFVKKDAWVSYGFDYEDKNFDRHYMHHTFFVCITLCLVGGATVMAFAPTKENFDWAQREAYLQLRYREEHGLPPVDPNLIDPAKIQLPTDEELGDTEIVI